MPKLCVRCGKNKPTVPDNTRMGRPILRVCSECHAIGLRNAFEFSLQAKLRQLAAMGDLSKLEELGYYLEFNPDPLGDLKLKRIGE